MASKRALATFGCDRHERADGSTFPCKTNSELGSAFMTTWLLHRSPRSELVVCRGLELGQRLLQLSKNVADTHPVVKLQRF